ncbi:Unknown protein sequence [Pseudomonas syringae pv. maculicola]|nr:Unknown protein sequence [Pseudomonas syringae pv. maculicola]
MGSDSGLPEAAGRGLSLIRAITAQHRCMAIAGYLRHY